MARPLLDGSNYHDVDLLNDLLETVESDPDNFEARQLLAEQYLALGWDDAAADIAERSLQNDPYNDGAIAILLACGRIDERPAPKTTTHTSTVRKPAHGKGRASDATAPIAELKKLRDGYRSLQHQAEDLLCEILVSRELAPQSDYDKLLSDLEAIVNGRIWSTATGKTSSPSATRPGVPPRKPTATAAPKATEPPKTPKQLAAAMKADPTRAVELAIGEFKRHPQTEAALRAGSVDEDGLRDALRKMVDVVKANLPAGLAYLASDAFMHIEHEFFGRIYVNDETMFGDSISEIPRENFFASEDGYAWDMSELVQAIKANSGVMRNPLSKDSFTVADVEAILRHPLGKDLAALQVEQSKLYQGVRQETVERLGNMAQVLLGDDAEDSRISRSAVDDFFNYVVTLPQTERDAIHKLKVPAKDSHTGQKYDATIGDALRDAKANLLCFHKAGDLCQQAAAYLSKGTRR